MKKKLFTRNALGALAVGLVAAGSSLVATLSPTWAGESEIFHPMMVTRTGPFASAASGVSSGQQDYFALVNMNGGIDGTKIRWEECDFGYKTPRALECYERYRGDWKIVYPNSTPAIFALAERLNTDEVLGINIAGGRSESSDGETFPFLSPVMLNFWSQAASTIRYIAELEGGEANLAGKKIAFIHIDNAYGRQPFPIFDALAEMYGFEWKSWPLGWPALEQSAAWVEIARRYHADWAIQWNYGQSCNVPMTEMKKVGFPLEKFIGTLWCGSEEDILPAGDLAKGYISANYHGVGKEFPVIQEIIEQVYGAEKGNIEEDRVGTVAYNRGVLTGIIIVEAFRNAIEEYGLPLDGRKVRDGFRMIKLDDARLAELGATGLLPPLAFSPTYHGGIDPQLFQQWDGEKWETISDWIPPYEDVVKSQIEKASAEYRAQTQQQ
ncbi:amino acid/amide ABC transporter substrate-binding protein, HAAT family [Roseovarius lutimaris]|uniref:Amino acid/amide ABC transporter substrate-binding protein, HAAT family n=1 Tax=Roseovarius lutimaris TaxID=1005928 RepID=A0A1I5GSN4_9RHOB|nr:ABC transporter substrate-binding protein [Roseovarius lutimaris]SFO38866.1 amino acid/amide ABC transporter substrate-binding protein, HAAT family [Roseovarius lutimaris]